MLKKNILILTYWSYKDGLIQSSTLPYVEMILKVLPEGSKIYLVTLEQPHMRMDKSERAHANKLLLEKGIHLLDFPYYKFGVMAILTWAIISMKLIGLIFLKRVQYIHAFCTPAGAIGYLLAKITHTKLVLDSYEPHAEAMVESGTWAKNSLAFKLLFYLEKKQTSKAEHFISVTENMRHYALEKYAVKVKNFHVRPTCTDFEVFSKNSKHQGVQGYFNSSDDVTCVYVGKFGDMYLGQEVFDFFKVAYDYWNSKFKVLLLSSISDEEITSYCSESNLPVSALIKIFVPHTDVPQYLAMADFGITPIRPIPSKKYCSPIKNGEYWAMGLPVVITKDISVDSEIIEREEIGAVIESLTFEGYFNAVAKIDHLLKSNAKSNLQIKIREIAIRNRSLDIAEQVYKQVFSI